MPHSTTAATAVSAHPRRGGVRRPLSCRNAQASKVTPAAANPIAACVTSGRQVSGLSTTHNNALRQQKAHRYKSSAPRTRF